MLIFPRYSTEFTTTLSDDEVVDRITGDLGPKATGIFLTSYLATFVDNLKESKTFEGSIHNYHYDISRVKSILINTSLKGRIRQNDAGTTIKLKISMTGRIAIFLGIFAAAALFMFGVGIVGQFTPVPYPANDFLIISIIYLSLLILGFNYTIKKDINAFINLVELSNEK
ncbi:MAG: hypothetical protein QNK23_18920 [Crocinitomicaceae bacterium]|nr:hypothetical protein [Crocinitomicaceae bacterium]